VSGPLLPPFVTTCRLRSPLLAIAALTLLSACAVNGDFGRQRPSPLPENIARLLPTAANGPAKAQSKFQLTDEERRMRDLAQVLTASAYDRDIWADVVGGLGLAHKPQPKPDPSAYATRLFKTAYRSQTARYNKLIEDMRNDVVQLDPFFAVAHYVGDMDSKREKSLAYVSKLSPEERNNTLKRIAENRTVVLSVRRSLAERTESYKIALERLVIEAPSPVAVEAERSLKLLQQRISAYSA
jgi:hypothetical protein